MSSSVFWMDRVFDIISVTHPTAISIRHMHGDTRIRVTLLDGSITYMGLDPILTQMGYQVKTKIEQDNL